MNTDKLREILENAHGMWGMVLKPIGQPIVFEHNADEVFRAASVNKVPVALYLTHLLETGKVGPLQSFSVTKEYYQPGSGVLQHLRPGLRFTVTDLIALMLIESDNTAAEVLVREYGAVAINSYIESLGFEKTRLGIKENDYDFGETTPREMAAILEGIYKTEDGKKFFMIPSLLGRMKKCKNQLGIKRYLAGVEVANKSGAGDHARNDVGIVFARQPYIITVFSKDLSVVSYKPDNPAALTIARLSQETYAKLG